MISVHVHCTRKKPRFKKKFHYVVIAKCSDITIIITQEYYKHLCLKQHALYLCISIDYNIHLVSPLLVYTQQQYENCKNLSSDFIEFSDKLVT